MTCILDHFYHVGRLQTLKTQRKSWSPLEEMAREKIGPSTGAQRYKFLFLCVMSSRPSPTPLDSCRYVTTPSPATAPASHGDWGVAKQAAVGQIPSPIDSSQARKHPERERHRCRNLAWQSALPARAREAAGRGWDGMGAEERTTGRTGRLTSGSGRHARAELALVTIRFSTRRASKSTHAR